MKSIFIKISIFTAIAALSYIGYCYYNNAIKTPDVIIQYKTDKGGFCSKTSECRSGSCHKGTCK